MKLEKSRMLQVLVLVKFHGIRKRTADFLKRLDYISMRENRGSEIVKELTGLDVPVILDPVLTLIKSSGRS